MGYYYDKWIEQEKKWAESVEAERKKRGLFTFGNLHRRYINHLNRELEREIPFEVEREEFALEMLGGRDGRKQVRFLEFLRQKRAFPERFCAVTSFAILKGMDPCLVRLDKTERIEVERAGNAGNASWPAFFYYYKPGPKADKRRERWADKVLTFPGEIVREEALRMVRKELGRE